MQKFLIVFLFSIGCWLFSAEARFRPARIFSDHMVLPHGVKFPVWGWSAVDQTITVDFAGSQARCRAKANEKWYVELPPVAISKQPAAMTICGSAQNEPVVLQNILVGEVWLCAGQSNMEMITGFEDEKNYRGILHYQQEIADSNLPMLRFLNVPKSMTGFPVPDAAMQWEECNAKSAEFFSAIGFLFARELSRKKDIPIGIVNISLGGAEVIRFMPEELVMANEAVPEAQKARIRRKNKKFAEQAALQNLSVGESRTRWSQSIIDACSRVPAQKPSLEWMRRNYKVPAVGNEPSVVCSGVFNGMFSPVMPYPICGILWYQGESDLALGADYAKLIVPLVQFWRKAWNRPRLPVYAVEIAPFDYTRSSWPMKNAPADQRSKLNAGIRAIRKLPAANTVNTDDLTSDMNNIHPRDKQSIARRLVDLAVGKSK